MPENKRQHYVPQNYLKGFSFNGDSIGVYVIETEQWHDSAKIKTQAQESYFYGADLTLEKGLSELEGLMADNRKTVVENTTQELSLYQKEVLYQDMMLQLSRTKQMADIYEQMATNKARRLWSHSSDELMRKHANDFGIKFANPILGPMMALLKNLTICLDLEFKILVNNTEIPFLTSDAPVSKYNKYFEAYHQTSCGLNSKGLILFYPLTPRFAVIYYDRNVYRVKFRKRVYLDITDESDVNNLNGLTCAWANQCVYYHPGLVDGEFVQWTFKHIQKARKPLVDETEIPQDESRSLVISRQTFPYLYMALTFMKFQDKVKPY